MCVYQILSTDSKLALVLKDITYVNAEGSVILDRFTLVVPRGQIVSVVGELQDAGEYLVAIIAGICQPTSGLLRSYRCPLEQRSVGVCPVHFFLLEELTVLENLQLYVSYRTSQGKSDFTVNHFDTLFFGHY